MRQQQRFLGQPLTPAPAAVGVAPLGQGQPAAAASAPRLQRDASHPLAAAATGHDVRHAALDDAKFPLQRHCNGHRSVSHNFFDLICIPLLKAKSGLFTESVLFGNG